MSDSSQWAGSQKLPATNHVQLTYDIPVANLLITTRRHHTLTRDNYLEEIMATEKKKPTESKKAKETKKVITEDVETFFKDVWGKVVEYASLGAEEATKVSSTAKTRVDIETLKFKRGKMLKILGERYFDAVSGDAGAQVSGTKEVIRQIRAIDREVKGLEKELTSAAAAKPAKKKPAAKKAAPKKAATPKTAKKKPAAKKAAPKKAAAPKTAKKKPAARKTAPKSK
jgi:hypothetical protein